MDTHESAPDPILLTAAQVARSLNISERYVRSLMARGDLKVKRIGSAVRVHRDELARFAADTGTDHHDIGADRVYQCGTGRPTFLPNGTAAAKIFLGCRGIRMWHGGRKRAKAQSVSADCAFIATSRRAYELCFTL